MVRISQLRIKGVDVPLAGALAVVPWARIPDRLVRHDVWFGVGISGVACCIKNQSSMCSKFSDNISGSTDSFDLVVGGGYRACVRRLVEVHDVEVVADIRVLCVLVCALSGKIDYLSSQEIAVFHTFS
jgi:hypothetical protein